TQRDEPEKEDREQHSGRRGGAASHQKSHARRQRDDRAEIYEDRSRRQAVGNRLPHDRKVSPDETLEPEEDQHGRECHLPRGDRARRHRLVRHLGSFRLLMTFRALRRLATRCADTWKPTIRAAAKAPKIHDATTSGRTVQTFHAPVTIPPARRTGGTLP